MNVLFDQITYRIETSDFFNIKWNVFVDLSIEVCFIAGCSGVGGVVGAAKT